MAAVRPMCWFDVKPCRSYNVRKIHVDRGQDERGSCPHPARVPCLATFARAGAEVARRRRRGPSGTSWKGGAGKSAGSDSTTSMKIRGKGLRDPCASWRESPGGNAWFRIRGFAQRVRRARRWVSSEHWQTGRGAPRWFAAPPGH